MAITGGRRRTTMKSAANRVLVLMIVALCAVAVQAQSEKMLKADVPFDFSIGDRQLASGSYTITSMGHEIECWQDLNNKQTTLFMTIPDIAQKPVAPKL